MLLFYLNTMEKTELDNTAPRELVNDWARYTINAFQRQLKKKKIGVSGALFRSFIHQLEARGGDVDAVMISFAMYGRFRDMGVGRGLKAYERKTNKANLIGAKRYGADVSYVGRQPKRWYPKLKTAESIRLQELLIERLGDKIVGWLSTEFSGEVRVG